MKSILNYLKKAVTPKVDTQAIIAEIHNEFDTAGEKLLNEARRILQSDYDTSKGERLKSIGFTSSKDAINAEAKLKEKKEQKELAELIGYYELYYPNNKFITEPIVKQICEKYGLFFADVSYYKGDVPEKNVSEIENFKLRTQDMTVTYPYKAMLLRHAQSDMMAQLANVRRGTPSIPRYEMPEITPEQYNMEHLEKPDYKICAPESDFDTTYLKKKGYKLELIIPDPIVLQPVKGGYLIVSKWGLEASDELVVNQKMN